MSPRIFLLSIAIICFCIRYSIPLIKSVSSIKSSDHHFALFLTQLGTESLDEVPNALHGMVVR